MSVGSRQVVAVYSGDGTFDPSSSPLDNHTVVSATTTTVLTVTPNPSVAGQLVEISATITVDPPGSGTATGLVTFTGPGDMVESVSLVNGVAVATVNTLSTGVITATYAGDANFAASSGSIEVNVEPGSTTTTLTVTPNPSVWGETVEVAATVVANPPSSGIPTGTVTFTGPGGLNQTVALDAAGSAALSTNSLETGTITATYNGDGASAGSVGTAAITVVPAETLTIVTPTPSPSVFGESVQISAVVTTLAPGSGMPTGTVTFIGPGGLNQTVVLQGGEATLTTTTLESGTIVATYSGSDNSNPSTGSATVTVNPGSTITTVAAAPDPSVYGEVVQLTATVAGSSSSSSSSTAPTGTVTFTGPGGFSVTATLDGSGVAVVTTTSLISGTVTATYSPDGPAYGSSTGTATVTVNPASTMTVVAATPDPSVNGQSVMVSATVATVPPGSGTPTGTVTFTGPGGLNQTVSLDASGEAALVTTMLQTGTITATYNGDGSFFGSSTGTVAVTVTPGESTTTLTALPNPSVFGQPVEIAATITANAPASGTPTGTVTFTGPGGLNQTVALDSSGRAALITATLTSGTVTATYNGDAGFNHSSGTITVTVNPGASTTTLTATPNPSVFGEAVTVHAKVAADEPAVGTPTGTVTFTGPGGINLTVALDSIGEAAFTTTQLGTGIITATYSGDTAFNGSAATTIITVNQGGSVTTVTATPNPSLSGESVTLSALVAAVAPAVGVPTGEVTFTGPGGLSKTVALDSTGAASVTTTTLATGTVTATYEGDADFAGSTGTTSVAVNSGDTTVTLVADPNPITFGDDVALTATISVNAPASGTPTGTVSFFTDGATLLGTADVAAGSATFTTSALVGGSNKVSAVYNGNDSFDPATSETVVVEVGPAEQTVNFGPIADAIAGDVVPLTATASSGLDVTFSVVSGPGIIAGHELTINEEGAIVVRATQAGDANYQEAFADQTVNSSKASQIITFGALSNRQATEEPFDLEATASSDLPVSFTVVSGPAMISGNTLTLTGAKGAVLVRASQAGNAAFEAAEDVLREFNVESDGDRVFFGDFFTESVAPTSESDAVPLATVSKIGDVAAVLPANGNDGFILIVAPEVGINELTSFTLNEDGSFNATVTQQAGPNVPTARTLPVEGELSGNVLTGFIEEVGLGFSTTIESVAGPSADVAGLYMSTSLDTAQGTTYTIVGAENNVLVLTVTPTLTVGGTATLQSNGSFQLETATPTETPVTINGAINAPTSTVSGTILVAGEAPASFAGLETTTLRTDRLIGLSSRGHVGEGEKRLISGLVIGGTEPKMVLIRAVGPTLSDLGVNNALVDPRISLFQGTTLIGENDNWATADNAREIADTAERIGAFALSNGSKDASLLRELEPGAYTVHVQGGEGIALAEVYDASQNPQSEYQRLVDIATRGEVGSGENVLIGGLAITGNSPKRVLIRGVGPGLTAQGVASVLADPVITVYRGGTVIGQNDNWSADATQATEITAAETATGAFHLETGSNDAAILLTLAPGNYTVHVSGANDATGVALVEIYEVAE
jgi:hypothetical protein